MHKSCVCSLPPPLPSSHPTHSGLIGCTFLRCLHIWLQQILGGDAGKWGLQFRLAHLLTSSRATQTKKAVCKFLFCCIIRHVKNRTITQIISSIVADLCIRSRVGFRILLKGSLTCQVQGQGSNHQRSDHCNDNLTSYSQTSRACWWQGGWHGWAVMLDNLVSFVG